MKTFRLPAIFAATFSSILCVGELVVFFLLLAAGGFAGIFAVELVVSLFSSIFFAFLTYYIIDSELEFIAENNAYHKLKETCLDNFAADNLVADKVKLLEDKVKELEDKLNNKTTTKKKD